MGDFPLLEKNVAFRRNSVVFIGPLGGRNLRFGNVPSNSLINRADGD